MNIELIQVVFNEIVFIIFLIASINWFINQRANDSQSNKKVKYIHWIVLAVISIIIMLTKTSRIIMVLDEYVFLFSYRTVYRFFTSKGTEILLDRSMGWPLFLANLSLITTFLGYSQIFLVNRVLYSLSVILFYELIRKITKNENFAFLFAVIYATTHSIVLWAISSENHTLSNLCLIIGFIFLFDFFEKPTTKNLFATLWAFAFSALARPENFFVLTIVAISVVVKFKSLEVHFKKRKNKKLTLIRRALIVNLIAISILTSLEFLRIIYTYNSMNLFGYDTKKFLFNPAFFLKMILHLHDPISAFWVMLFCVSIILLITKKDRISILIVAIFFTFLSLFYTANFEPNDLLRFNYPLILPMYITIALASKHILNKKSTRITLMMLFILVAILSSIRATKDLNDFDPLTINYVKCITSINFTEGITDDYLVIAPIKFQYYFLNNEIKDYNEFKSMYNKSSLPSKFLLIIDNNSWHINELSKILSKNMPLIKELERKGIIEPAESIKAREGCNLEFYESVLDSQ